MTIRRKLIISNIIMIIIPVIVAVILGVIALVAFGSRYWESFEEVYDDENGMIYAQSRIYAYKEELPFQVSARKKLEKMGYGLRITADETVLYNSLQEQEEEKLRQYFTKGYEGIDNLTLHDQEASFIKYAYVLEETSYVVEAVCLDRENDSIFGKQYLKQKIVVLALGFFVVVLATIVVTNVILSRIIAKMILKPIRILKEGAGEIAGGNLEFELAYSQRDEFGDMCLEFEKMRDCLKESVETRQQYEQYRKTLIAGISHDLRTPLTSIKGYVEGLKDNIANTEEKRTRYYNAIHVRALDMERLLDSLSTFTRLEDKQYKYRLETVDMDEYIRQIMQDMTDEAQRRHVTMRYENHAAKTTVQIDIQEIYRVFVNLFENAVKYRTKDTSVMEIELKNEENQFMLLVKDDGPGVAESELTHIFTSFYRGDSARTMPGKGSGLGLAIVKQIIEGHGGTIEAKQDNGLCMVITLPFAEREGDTAI